MTDDIDTSPSASGLAGVAATADWAASLEVFYGQATPGECRLYVRLEGLDCSDGWRLAGSIHGPECRYAETLPATYPLRDCGPGSTLLAEAFVPDPCFWSPALPQLYSATVELRRGDNVCGRTTRLVGIRPLGTRGRDLYWEGKRWVLRGVLCDEIQPPTSVRTGHVNEDPDVPALGDWHAGPTSLLADCPTDELCRQASIDGVLVVPRLSATTTELATELDRLARWPSVGVAILEGVGNEFASVRRRFGNILLAQRFSAGSIVTPAAWAEAVVVDVGPAPLQFAASVRDCRLPVIACRPAGAQSDVATGRGHCDLLQRDLAPFGDFAGYVV